MFTQRDNVDNQNSVLQWGELEVGKLDKGPDHPVLGQGALVCRFNLLLWVGAFHDGHVVEEAEQVDGSEDALIKADTGKDLAIG